MVNTTQVTVQYDDDLDEFTCLLEYCDPYPGRHIYAGIEGRGQTLSDALRDLADQVAAEYEAEQEEQCV